MVAPDGSFAQHVPAFAGKRILTPEGKDGDANGAVIKELIERGKLLAKGTLRHSYPHSWRSKAPVIFRATPQWFVGDRQADSWTASTLRAAARMKAIGDTKWYPPRGENRIGAHGEGPARLGAVAPARLGRAAGDLRRKEDRRGPERSRRLQAHRGRRSRPKAPMPGSPRRRRASWATTAIPTITSRSRTFSMSGSIPARPMSSRSKIRIEPQWPQKRSRRSLSRRLGPASRLVPVVAAGKLRHARPRALRRRADPRLRAGRAGPTRCRSRSAT